MLYIYTHIGIIYIIYFLLNQSKYLLKLFDLSCSFYLKNKNTEVDFIDVVILFDYYFVYM
jgi:hypothetical protein